MSKATPGPWRVKHQKGGFCSIVYTEKKTLSTGHYFPEVASVSPTNSSYETSEEKANGHRYLVLVNANPAMTKPHTDCHAEMVANAHLIAAAPDMLAALKVAAEDLKAWEACEGVNVEVSYNMIMAAITKAEGKS